ncbi:unnamed protein product [Arabidopsis lyrata]|nr:unnamed protein product [Arabidopsis lyrata]
MIEKQQALELKKAGFTAYNHNLDTSREYYPNVITTRSYDNRFETLEHVREAGINVCSGGIIGLGEAEEDRVGLLHTLATLPSHPESVPINALLAPIEIWEMIWNRTYCNAKSNGEIICWESLVLNGGAGPLFPCRCKLYLHRREAFNHTNNVFDSDQLMSKTLGIIPKPPRFSEDDSESEKLRESCFRFSLISLSTFFCLESGHYKAIPSR